MKEKDNSIFLNYVTEYIINDIIVPEPDPEPNPEPEKPKPPIETGPVNIYVNAKNANYTESEINNEIATRTTSHKNPYKYLQNAINDAKHGDKILIYNDVYYPTHLKNSQYKYTQGDHLKNDATFSVDKLVEIKAVTDLFTYENSNINVIQKIKMNLPNYITKYNNKYIKDYPVIDYILKFSHNGGVVLKSRNNLNSLITLKINENVTHSILFRDILFDGNNTKSFISNESNKNILSINIVNCIIENFNGSDVIKLNNESTQIKNARYKRVYFNNIKNTNNLINNSNLEFCYFDNISNIKSELIKNSDIRFIKINNTNSINNIISDSFIIGLYTEDNIDTTNSIINKSFNLNSIIMNTTCNNITSDTLNIGSFYINNMANNISGDDTYNIKCSIFNNTCSTNISGGNIHCTYINNRFNNNSISYYNSHTNINNIIYNNKNVENNNPISYKFNSNTLANEFYFMNNSYDTSNPLISNIVSINKSKIDLNSCHEKININNNLTKFNIIGKISSNENLQIFSDYLNNIESNLKFGQNDKVFISNKNTGVGEYIDKFVDNFIKSNGNNIWVVSDFYNKSYSTLKTEIRTMLNDLKISNIDTIGSF